METKGRKNWAESKIARDVGKILNRYSSFISVPIDSVHMTRIDNLLIGLSFEA